jgi:hypothetical protein
MMTKVLRVFIVLVMFAFLMLAIYLIHSLFFTVDVVFYSAIIDSLISVFIIFCVILYSKYFKIFDAFEKMQILVVLVLLGYIFSISIPTVIDRSLSFYILEKIQQRGGSIKLTAVSDIIVNEYILEHRLADIRITEQIKSGTIRIEDECIVLTNFGEQIATFSRFFRKNFLPKNRLINGKYTNDLTDPFRNSTKIVNYKCAK